MSLWLTAREITGLPGFEVSERHVRNRLVEKNVPQRKRAQRGGGVEFDCTALPAETRAALMLPDPTPTPTPKPTPLVAFVPPPGLPLLPTQPDPLPATLPSERPKRMATDREKEIADARMLLVQRCGDLCGDLGVRRGAQKFALMLHERQAEPALLEAAARATERPRQGMRASSIDERTVRRWMTAYQQHGWFSLLPTGVSKSAPDLGPDVVAVLDRYHSTDPRFANLTSCAKQVTRELGRDFDSWGALCDRARRALAKVDKVQLIKSRHGGSERAAKLPFKRRSTEGLAPLDVWLIDGHTFKAKVRHPDHGAPFAPEVTMVMDAKTRMVCGWSVSLSENVIAVGDALLHAMANHGQPGIVYTDNGPGQTGKQIDCPVTGIMARLGITHKTGIPGRPQGHGLIERSWQRTMLECARQFGSYQGGDVDEHRLRKVTAELAKEQRLVRRAQAAGGTVLQLSPKAPSWQQFMDAVEAAVTNYNDTHRHRSLPKREDGLHMTPAEAWGAMLNPELQHREDPLSLRMLFMPCVQCTAQRGEVVFLNQHYYAPELMRVNGERVRVHYDIRNPAWVIVQNFKGEVICRAEWNANRIDYFPKPVIEMAREKRVRGIVKRRQLQIDTALRELSHTRDAVVGNTVFLPAPGASSALVPVVPGSGVLQPLGTAVSHDTGAAQATPGRPVFDTPSERYEWLMADRGRWNDSDDDWLHHYVASEHYEDLREFYESRGLAWTDSGGAADFEGVR